MAQRELLNWIKIAGALTCIARDISSKKACEVKLYAYVHTGTCTVSLENFVLIRKLMRTTNVNVVRGHYYEKLIFIHESLSHESLLTGKFPDLQCIILILYMLCDNVYDTVEPA